MTGAEFDSLRDRLRRLPAKFRHYGAWKVRLDPLYALALGLLEGRREVVDLGAGMGLVAALLHERSPTTRTRCVEWDPAKAGAARALLQGIDGVTVELGDARTVELGTPDAILLFDVLHYLPIAEQRAWLVRCADALAPGGVVLVRELDVERSRLRLSERIERWAVKSGWNRGGGVTAWPLSALSACLEERGLRVDVRPAGRGIFSRNALVVARKPCSAGERLDRPHLVGGERQAVTG